MNYNKLKTVLLTLILLLSCTLIGCSTTENLNSTTPESKVNVTKLLEYKDSYVGDNSAVSHIISNLPANIYNEGFELQTTLEPYEITIYYKDFKSIFINLGNNTITSDSFIDITKKNALIIFSLIKNAGVVNFYTDSGNTVTYEKTHLVTAYKETYGDSLEKLTADASTLEDFIKNPIN